VFVYPSHKYCISRCIKIVSCIEECSHVLHSCTSYTAEKLQPLHHACSRKRFLKSLCNSVPLHMSMWLAKSWVVNKGHAIIIVSCHFSLSKYLWLNFWEMDSNHAFYITLTVLCFPRHFLILCGLQNWNTKYSRNTSTLYKYL